MNIAPRFVPRFPRARFALATLPLLAVGINSARAVDVNFHGSPHFTAAWSYDSLTNTEGLIGFEEHTFQPHVGSWHSIQSSGSEVYSEQHNFVSHGYIDVDITTNLYRTYHGTGPDAPYTERFGESLFWIEFQVLNTVRNPYFVSRGASFVIMGSESGNVNMQLTESTTIPDLTPGYYVFGGAARAGSSQSGTLFLPTPGALTLLAPLSLYAARRRR